MDLCASNPHVQSTLRNPQQLHLDSNAVQDLTGKERIRSRIAETSISHANRHYRSPLATMSADLIYPPPQMPPATALRMSQQAPRILQTSPETSLPYPLSLITSSETQETWTTYENLLLSCLRTGDDKSALICVQRLAKRFGDDDPRVMAWKGLYEEAVAKDDKALEKVLKDYEKVLKEDPTNMVSFTIRRILGTAADEYKPVRKRRIALLKSMSKHNDAISALVELLDASPTDVEAWSELAELYASQSLYDQAIYSLEEVMLITPNAWSVSLLDHSMLEIVNTSQVHARMAEINYLKITSASNNDDLLPGLSKSMRRYCRSIELCDNYLRGYYGLKLVTSRILEVMNKGTKSSSSSSETWGGLAPPEKATVEKLNEVATAKLAELIRCASKGEPGWEGFDPAEVIAARELLDRDTQSNPR